MSDFVKLLFYTGNYYIAISLQALLFYSAWRTVPNFSTLRYLKMK